MSLKALFHNLDEPRESRSGELSVDLIKLISSCSGILANQTAYETERTTEGTKRGTSGEYAVFYRELAASMSLSVANGRPHQGGSQRGGRGVWSVGH